MKVWIVVVSIPVVVVGFIKDVSIIEWVTNDGVGKIRSCKYLSSIVVDRITEDARSLFCLLVTGLVDVVNVLGFDVNVIDVFDFEEGLFWRSFWIDVSVFNSFDGFFVNWTFETDLVFDETKFRTTVCCVVVESFEIVGLIDFDETKSGTKVCVEGLIKVFGFDETNFGTTVVVESLENVSLSEVFGSFFLSSWNKLIRPYQFIIAIKINYTFKNSG